MLHPTRPTKSSLLLAATGVVLAAASAAGQRGAPAFPFAPGEACVYRGNGPLGNVEEFYAAFGVKPGDKLYIEPAKRVKIW